MTGGRAIRPASPNGLAAEDVRAACDAYLNALDVAGQMLAAYREMVGRFAESGTFAVDDESRAKLDALESDESVFTRMDELDKLRRQGGAK